MKSQKPLEHHIEGQCWNPKKNKAKLVIIQLQLDKQLCKYQDV